MIGNDHKVYQMDRTGSILDSFDVNLENDVNVEISALCIDQQKTLIFSLSWPHTNVCKYGKGDTGITMMLDLSPCMDSIGTQSFTRRRSLGKHAFL